MSYIIDYNIFAIVLVVIVLISFLTRKRFGGRQSRYFLFLLLSTIGALVLEILSVAGGDVRMFTGEAAWIINIGCLLSVNLLLALTSGYIATITECERKVARRATAVLAVINTICCLAIITSRWTGVVFRILPGGIYERGPGHSLLYVAMASYITFISYVCVRYRKNMGMRRFMAVNSFCTLLIAAVAIQFLLPRYLVNLPAASLSLLIISKRRDIFVLRSMGMRDVQLRRAFFAEGMLICLAAVVSGLIIGFTVCWLQQHFGIIRMGDGNFVVSAFPVAMRAVDFLYTFLLVMTLSSLSVALTVTRRL